MSAVTLKVPPKIIYGSGSASTVGQEVRLLGAKHVLLISDHGLQGAGIVDEVAVSLKKEGLSFSTYLEVEIEPSVESVRPCVEFASREAYDVVIGLGGGSVLDTAKVTAMLLTNGGAVEDYLGADLVKHPGLPTILMPTTAGTGAEVTPNALFYVPARRNKEAVVSQFIVPAAALVDPALTLSLPPHITAATGIDALCHAIESFTASNATPLSMPFAREAIRLIAIHLRKAVVRPDDLAAREGMALGSLYAAISLANSGTNAVHALAYPLQGLNRITHGVANSLLLPYVLEFNLLGDLQRFAAVAELMGQPTAHLLLRDAAGACARLCQQLTEDVGIPKRMRDVGIQETQLDDLVEGAWAVQRLLRNNPRPINREDIRAIYKRAF